MDLRKRYINDLLHNEKSLFKRYIHNDERNPIRNYLKTNAFKDDEINEELLAAFHESMKMGYHKDYDKSIALLDEFINSEHMSADVDDPNFFVFIAGIRTLREPIVTLKLYEKYLPKIKEFAEDSRERVQQEAIELLKHIIEKAKTHQDQIKEVENWAKDQKLL